MLTDEKDSNKNESSDSTPSLTLRVSEALPKDVGRGIARLDPEDMKRLGVGLGEIIEITGKRSTVAKVLPAYQDDRGKNIISIDGIIRDNAQTGIDDKVQIRKVAVHPANKIVLSPMTLLGARPEEEHSRYIGRLMEGMPIMAGDRVRATLFGSKIQDFKVDSTIPAGAVIISSSTLLRIKEEDVKREGAPARSGKVTYEDIGGLHKEIQRVREMIELPLRYPQIFDRLGIDAPKGVLLLGPPGCGKTLIARAVANETDAYFLSVSGPEVIHKFYGDSEARLRQIFDQAAKNAPAIVFIDEIDSIAPKREKVIGDVEKRVVAQLLALMDGLKDRGQLIVIAATNLPNVLDPALRRPGRFDREISIGIPDKFGRLEILQIHTRGMPLSDDVNLERLAEITHGYVGADLEALCREAAMVALRRIIPNIDFSMESIPYEALLELQVTMDNFLRAFAEIEPSTTREVFTEIPDVKWNDIGGLESIKQELQEAVEWPLKYSDAFEHTNITPPGGILLYGAPGTGKTMLAKAVATESEANFISIKGPELLCVAADTPIFTEFCGITTIEDFFERTRKNSEVEFLNQNLEVRKLSAKVGCYGINPYGKIVKTNIARIHKLFVPDAFRIGFSDNNEVIASMNQPFLTFRDGEIKWIRSAELAIDDYVAKPLSLPTFDKIIEIKLPEYEHLQLVKEDDNFCYAKIKTAGEDTIVRLPKKLDEQLAEFLGLFVSEGSISKNGVTICNSDPKLRERITQLFEELFVPDSRIKRSKKGITVYSTPLVKYLERVLGMPLGQKKSHSIKLPMELAKGTVEVIAGFLRGAYNGDGHRCETMITYGTMSKQLAQGITYLLTLLGIKSKFWQNKKGLFLITISGKKEIQAFNRIVYGEEIGEEVRRYYNARYTLPDVSNLLYQTKKELGIRYGREIPEGLTEAVISGRKSCGRIRLQRIMKSFEPYLTDAFRESSIYQTLKFIADSDVSWIRVTDIDKAEPQEMYDLETEVGSFVGGNLPLILHNSKWVGDSEAGIREVFKKARQAAPCILFLDELDAMAPSRSGGASDSHVSERVVSQLLTEMDGIEDMRGVVVLAATNRLDIIDAALLRPGRFDLLLELPVPDETARRAIFGVHTKNKPIADDIDLDRLVKETDGRVGSDIELICRRAAMLAIREFLQNKDNLGNGKPDYSSIKIRMEHFVKAMEILKRET